MYTSILTTHMPIYLTEPASQKHNSTLSTKMIYPGYICSTYIPPFTLQKGNRNIQSTIHIASQVVHPEKCKAPCGGPEVITNITWNENKWRQPLDDLHGYRHLYVTYGNHYNYNNYLQKTVRYNPAHLQFFYEPSGVSSHTWGVRSAYTS